MVSEIESFESVDLGQGMAGNGSRTPGGSEKLVSTQKRRFFDGFFPFMFINSIGNPMEWDESQDFWRYVVLPVQGNSCKDTVSVLYWRDPVWVLQMRLPKDSEPNQCVQCTCMYIHSIVMYTLVYV